MVVGRRSLLRRCFLACLLACEFLCAMAWMGSFRKGHIAHNAPYMMYIVERNFYNAQIPVERKMKRQPRKEKKMRQT